ncbi:unnamed protein product [Effrenium voratum]|nr:unnamed protein product [Effrenium voratum]
MEWHDQELCRLLVSLGSAESTERKAAEAALEGARFSAGFAARLAAFGAAGPGSQEAVPLRQLALTILRQLTQKHWSQLGPEDQHACREALLRGMAEPDRRLQGLLLVSVANTRSAGPWPELDQRLLRGITQYQHLAEAVACVECIVALLDDGTLDVAKSLSQLQAPLLQLASSEAPPELRRSCAQGLEESELPGHWAFGTISFRRSQKRLNVRQWGEDNDNGKAHAENRMLTREIRNLGRTRRFEEAKQLFDDAEAKDPLLYSAMISAATASLRFDDGIALFEELKSGPLEVTDNVYAALLQLHGEQGDYEAARRAWENLHSSSAADRGSLRQQSCFTGLLKAAAAQGDAEQIRKDLESAPENVTLNAAHFGCWMKACRENADPEQAKEVILRMREANIQRNIVHYTMYLGTCARFVEKTQNTSAIPELEQRVREQMAADEVEPNDYFLEELVALKLGVGSLRALQQEDANRPSEEALARAQQAFQEADERGLRLTRCLRTLRDRFGLRT